MRTEFQKGDAVLITRKIHSTNTSLGKTVTQEGKFLEYSGSARAWVEVRAADGVTRRSFPLINLAKKETA